MMKTTKKTIQNYSILFFVSCLLMFGYSTNVLAQTENDEDRLIYQYYSDDITDADAKPDMVTTFEILLDAEFINGFTEGNKTPSMVVCTYKTDSNEKMISGTKIYSTCTIKYSNFREVSDYGSIYYMMDCNLIPDPKKNLLPASFPRTFILGIPGDEVEDVIMFDKNVEELKELRTFFRSF